MTKLSPVVAFPLAATINPFKGESHDLVVKVLKHSGVATHSVITEMSK